MARVAAAVPTTVDEASCHRTVNRGVEIGVVEDDERCLAAEPEVNV